MRIGVAQLAQESGSFLPQKSDMSNFRRGTLLFGSDFAGYMEESAGELGGGMEVLRAQGAEIVPLMGAAALPWGPLTAKTRSCLVGELADRIRAAAPVDGLFLVLHGALLAEDEDDVDGAILQTAREIVGPDVPIAATLDPHAHITARMVANADILVTYSTVPHVDYYSTGQKAARILAEAVAGACTPVMAWRRLPMITPAETHDTGRAPMSRLMEVARAIERRPEVLSCSLAHVQPWLDVPGLGWASLVVANGDIPSAQRYADELASLAWSLRDNFLIEKVDPRETVARCAASAGTVVVSDSGDNTGGGGAGDSTVLLAAVLEANPVPRALVSVTDPAATEAAHRAGIGAHLDLVVGATVDTVNSRPVALKGTVRSLPHGSLQVKGPTLHGTVMELGKVAIIDSGPVTVLLSEHALYNVDPELLRQLGLEPTSYQLVHTKSPCGFRAGYEAIATDVILMQSPGFTSSDFASLPWSRIERPLFPLDDVPERLPWQEEHHDAP